MRESASRRFWVIALKDRVKGNGLVNSLGRHPYPRFRCPWLPLPPSRRFGNRTSPIHLTLRTLDTGAAGSGIFQLIWAHRTHSSTPGTAEQLLLPI
jgi:hypothetical protein